MEQPEPPSSILALTRAGLPARRDNGLGRRAAIVRHILVCNLTLGVVRSLFDDRSAGALPLSNGVPLNKYSTVSLVVFNAPHTTPDVQRASATRDNCSVAKEAVVARNGINYNEITMIGLILQTKRCDRDIESTACSKTGGAIDRSSAN